MTRSGVEVPENVTSVVPKRELFEGDVIPRYTGSDSSSGSGSAASRSRSSASAYAPLSPPNPTYGTPRGNGSGTVGALAGRVLEGVVGTGSSKTAGLCA